MPSVLNYVRSITFRFAALLTVLFVATILTIGLAAEHAVRLALLVHSQTRVKQTLAELVREFDRDGEEELEEALALRLQIPSGGLHYLVRRADGRVLIGESMLDGVATKVGDGQTAIVSPGLSQGARAVVGLRRLRGGQVLIVGDDLGSIDYVLSVMRKAFGRLLLGTAILGLLAGIVSSRYLLRQLDTINRTALAIIGGDLRRRIARAGTDDEFDRLRETLNRMLDKIGDLLVNIQQVSTDIAHDLRTPLARLRHRLEEIRAAAEPHGLEPPVDRAIAEIDGIMVTFSALLRIAQIESGSPRSQFAEVDLSGVVQLVADTFGAVAEDGGRTLLVRIEQGCSVMGDRELLVQLFSNLVENSLIHTPPRSTLALDLRKEAGRITAVVSDDGSGIAQEERALVTRRFYRSQKSRSTPGSGLGLSLASAIAELHGSDLLLLDNEPGLRVEMRFVLAAEHGGAPIPGSAPASVGASHQGEHRMVKL